MKTKKGRSIYREKKMYDLPSDFKKIEKPPLGLVPERIRIEQRAIEIEEAAKRYKQSNKLIPLEWIDELKSMSKRLLELSR